MGETAICEIPKGMVPPASGIGTLGSFFESTPVLEKKIGSSDERLIQELLRVLDRQLLSAVDARSVAEFDVVRDNVFPRYIRGLRALNETVINLVPPELLECLVDCASKDLTQDLENQRERFGDKLTDQAVFSLWTNQKIRALAARINEAGKVADDKSQQDTKLRHEYNITSLWAQFHLDVVLAAVRLDRSIWPEVKGTITEGLRASVNAYVIMKDALSLRVPEEEGGSVLHLPWDEEDERLLASSMRDINGGQSPVR